MAAPAIKNFFLFATGPLLAHKPGLLVGVSSGRGGAYPLAEMRMSSYKNSRICWIPEQVIVREAGALRDAPEDTAAQAVKERLHYGLQVLLAYSEALKSVRQAAFLDYKRFAYGM